MHLTKDQEEKLAEIQREEQWANRWPGIVNRVLGPEPYRLEPANLAVCYQHAQLMFGHNSPLR